MRNKFFAIFKKDLKLAISYRFGFIFQFISIFGQLLIFYFMSEFIQLRNLGQLNDMDYFSFVLIGLCLNDIGSRLVSTPSREFANMKSSGVLEEILQLNLNNYLFGLATSLYPIFISFIRLIIYFIILSLISEHFIFSFEKAVLALFTLILFMLSIIWVSMIASAYSLVFFTTNFIVSFFISFSIIFGGIFFDYKILPEALHFLSNFTPFAPTLEILRWSFLGYELSNSIVFNFLILAFQNIVLFLLSIFLFSRALKHAKKNGTLLFY